MRSEESGAARRQRVQDLTEAAENNRRLTHRRGLLGYAYAALTQAPLYLRWRALLDYLRRLRLIAWILRITGVLLTLLQTGALVLLTTVILLLLFSLTVVLIPGLLAVWLVESRRGNRRLLEVSRGRPICLLFLSPQGKGNFQAANARDLAARGYTVLAVSPYWISAKGLTDGRLYAVVRPEFEQVYLIRRCYFFSLRRRLLKGRSCVYVY